MLCLTLFCRPQVRLCALQNASGNALKQLLAQSPDGEYQRGGVLDDSQWTSWRNWTAVQVASEERPELVVQLLLKGGEYDLVRDWSRIHDVPPQLLKVSQICTAFHGLTMRCFTAAFYCRAQIGDDSPGTFFYVGKACRFATIKSFVLTCLFCFFGCMPSSLVFFVLFSWCRLSKSATSVACCRETTST